MINLIKRYIVDFVINYIVPIPHLVSVIGLATFVAQSILGSNEIIAGGTLVICATVGYSMIVIDIIGRAL